MLEFLCFNAKHGFIYKHFKHKKKSNNQKEKSNNQKTEKVNIEKNSGKTWECLIQQTYSNTGVVLF